MIGPSSSSSAGQGPCKLEEPSKKRLFDVLDCESPEETSCQSLEKRYLQDAEGGIELVPQVLAEGSHLFQPHQDHQDNVDGQVARLEVLLVDGTNCTWTTISDLQNPAPYEYTSITDSPSSLSSYSSGPGRETLPEEIHIIHEMSYPNYWNPGRIEQPPESPGKRLEGNSRLALQQYDDQETGNLSWLLDFKLDPFIEAPDDRACVGPIRSQYRTKLPARNFPGSLYGQDPKRACGSNSAVEAAGFQQETQINYCHADERNLGNRVGSPKKPPFTYTELIEHALQEKGELTVSAIYQWISERYPYYKSNDDRWKNSVRHNLSINPHFRKGSKAPHGAGHLWAIANRSEGRPRPFLSSNGSSGAVTSRTATKHLPDNESKAHAGSDQGQISAVDEVEMATASIMQPPSEEQVDLANSSVTLEHCAGQILSGVKKQVEVQYLVPMTIANSHEHLQASQPPAELQYPVKESDFLNPVSKEVLAEECGLISEGYLVTELNPASLGLNLVDPELISPENLFGEELNFQFYELASPSQMQSA